MPRIARVVAVGLPHHITQRGNYKQKVFSSDRDINKYLKWIEQYRNKYSLKIIAYCLMNNHVHYVAIPKNEDSLSRTFNTAHMRYSQYVNFKAKLTGHLWQGRFNSCILDNNHLIAAVRYIERNPVRAGIVKKPWDWKWSSAGEHTSSNNSVLSLADLFELIDYNPDSWREYIDDTDENGFLKDIRKYTKSGHPLGNNSFIKELENNFNRNLIKHERGRPKKTLVLSQ